MPMRRDEWNEYNRQRTKDRHGGTNLLTNGGYQLPRVLKTRDLVLLYPEHPNMDQFTGSTRIRYRAWTFKICHIPFRKFLRLSKLRNRTGDPDRGKYWSILIEMLSPRWDALPIRKTLYKIIHWRSIRNTVISKLLFQILVREIHNIMVSPPEEGGLKESKYAENNIIIQDSILCNTLRPQLKKITAQSRLMCGCERCIYEKNMHSYLLTWHDHHLKQLKYRSQNAQNRRSGEISSRISEIYKIL